MDWSNAMADGTPTGSRQRVSKWLCSSCSFTNSYAVHWPTAVSTTNLRKNRNQTANWKPPTTRPIPPSSKLLTYSPPLDDLEMLFCFFSTMKEKESKATQVKKGLKTNSPRTRRTRIPYLSFV